jgi:ketol-acid reductoisomerase
MGQILEEIRSGAFAEEFIGDIKAGGQRMTALREQAKGSQIEAVGKELRGMMPFVSGGRKPAS